MPRREFKFKVIEGGQEPPSSWLNIPKTVVARSPFDKEQPTRFRVSQTDPRKGLANGRRQPTLDLWSVVLGEIPPVNNANRWSHERKVLSSLASAYACFRGIKRPNGEDARGWDYFIYISKPKMHFVYQADMVCVIRPENIADDLVHATYVKLDYPEERPMNLMGGENHEIRGIVTHWEFIESEDGQLPNAYSDRYRQRLW